VAVDAVGAGLFAPLALVYFVRVAGLGLTTVGGLATAAAVASLPVPVFAGHLADRLGPRPVVVSAQLLQAAGFLAYPFARTPAAVLGLFVLTTAGQRLFWSSFMTLVAALPGPADRRFAITGMTQAAGYGAGALLAAAVLGVDSGGAYEALALANGVSFLLSALLLPPGSAPEPQARPSLAGAYRRVLRDRPYLRLTVANTGFAICSVTLGIGLPMYVVEGLHASGWIAGPLLAVNTALLATGQLSATRVVSHLPRVRALMLAGVLWAAWGLLTAVAAAVPESAVLPWLAACTLLYSAAELVHAPISNALAAERAPAGARGSYLAAFQYGFTIATLVVPAAFTALFAVSPALPWLTIAVLALVSSASIRSI
jgi:MFS family permease